MADTGWGKAVWGKFYGQWFAGATVFVFDHEKFNADTLLRQIEKYHVTSFCAPPTIYRFMIREDLSKYDLSSLEYCTTAGEALNPAVFDKFLEKTGIKMMEGFGQTETTMTQAATHIFPQLFQPSGRQPEVIRVLFQTTCFSYHSDLALQRYNIPQKHTSKTRINLVFCVFCINFATDMEIVSLPMWAWILFYVLVFIMLFIDLKSFGKKGQHEVSVSEALKMTVVWIAVSLIFCGGIYLFYPGDAHEKAMEFLAGYLIEKSLSMDNLFVFLMLFSY